MRLRRIEITQFRKLAGPVVLDNLGDGLIVISGDNEEGKSTVLAALKAAFFEHHTVGGAVREAMAPHRGGTPEIAVEFECAGAPHRLHKAFRRAGVVLESAGQRLQDDAAERRLQDLLRFERRHARSPRPENAGVQALFWVDQATAFRDFDGVAGGRDRLSAAIAVEVGAVAGGDSARRLLAVARERAAGYFTPGRQQETGTLKAAGERLRELGTEHAELDRRRREFDARVDQLGRLRSERARSIEQDQAGRARERCEAARRTLAELTDLEQRCRTAVEAVKAAGADEARITAQHRMRSELIAESQALEAALARLAERTEAAEREVEVLRHGAEAGRAAETEAMAAVEQAERAAVQARDAIAAARLTTETLQLAGAQNQCEVAQERLRRTQAELATNPITSEGVGEARGRHRDCEEATVRLVTATTRLDFRPLSGQRIRVAGRDVDPAQPFMVGRPVELELAGFGRLVVTPGGEDLASRQVALNSAQVALTAALAAIGCQTLGDAESGLERRREMEAESRRDETEIKAILQANGSRSVDALAQLCAQREVELANVRSRISLGADLSDESSLTSGAASRAEALDCARAVLDEARQSATAAQRRLAEAEAALAGLRGERQASETRLPELLARLAADRATQTDDVLLMAHESAGEARRAAEFTHDRHARELESGDVEGLRDRLAIAERELSALDGERRRLDTDIRDLEVALRESGADSWIERLSEIPVALEAARVTHQRLDLEGRAWRLLAEKLAAADQSVRETLEAPICQRLRPLLQRVFPGAEPVVDPENLSLTHVNRDGAQEPFDSLSIGAREQVAVLVRLAFASLLAEREGEPPCLILDDALVYADETRFATMKAILQRAARQMQILILTCRPRDYYGLEARYLRLEDCRPR